MAQTWPEIAMDSMDPQLQASSGTGTRPSFEPNVLE